MARWRRNNGGHPTAARSVLLHAGTHKTGTTSLQALFTQHRGALRARGILYPTSGVLPNDYEVDIHTNIAWELMGHNSFDPAIGTLDDLIAEVASSDCEKVLLSSEEFSRLFDKPARMRLLKDAFEDLGFTPTVALVFRDVAEYADSMFITLVGHGLTVSHGEFAWRVKEERRVTIKGNTYCFDHEVLKRSFSDVFGSESVTCLEYDAEDSVRPFLDAFDWFFEGALDGVDANVRRNTTMDRIEGLRDSMRAGEARIADLEAEIERLTAELDRIRAHTRDRS